MGRTKEPLPVKLFMSLITGEEDALQHEMKELQREWGETDFTSERFQFDFTDYYAEEMGENLFRRFVTFKRLIPRNALPEIKVATNRLEERGADPLGRRRINIDPGYLCLEHVVLATTKAYTHRPYIGEGIYADLTLIYKKKSFQALDWTYPDYRRKEVIQLFNGLRGQYSEDLKGKKPC